MSTLKVKVVEIDAISPIPKADRLELAHVKGWQVTVSKGQFLPGSRAVYIPVDSILPAKLEALLFPEDSKIKLHKSRVRSIKIRGALSQGMLVLPSLIGCEKCYTGTDVTAQLGITKYEPPEDHLPTGLNVTRKGTTKQPNPHFRKYTDMENIKNHVDLFEPGELVYISEKLHGTSARYMNAPKVTEGWFSKCAATVLRWLGVYQTHEFVYGSRNIQLQRNKNPTPDFGNVYAKIAVLEGVEDKLEPGESIYGEIVGSGIQKNYTYGFKAGEHKFFAYDAAVDGKWLDYEDFVMFCESKGFTRVPELYVGPYSKEVVDATRAGDSLVGGQKVREGCVVKAKKERHSPTGRSCLKAINDEYYLAKDNSDFH